MYPLGEDVTNMTPGLFAASSAVVTTDPPAVVTVDARTYDVALHNVSGSGTLSLALNSASGVEDLFGNAVDITLPTTYESYTIDHSSGQNLLVGSWGSGVVGSDPEMFFY